MADIRKNLTLSAQLDDSQLRKQLDILKKEMGSAFSVDAGSLNDLKASIRDIAKEFGATIRKELDGIRGPRSKQNAQSSGKTEMNIDEIGSIQVKEMTVTNMVVASMTVKGSGGGNGGGGNGRGGSGAPENQDDEPKEPGAADWLKKNKTMLAVGAASMAVKEGVGAFINIQQSMAERSNRMSRDLDAGLGVEGVAREAGRSRMGLASAAGVAGAVGGGLLGAKALGAAGSFFGPLGTAIGAGVGAVGGAAIGGISSYIGTSNAMGEMSKEQVQLLADSEARARAISPMRQQMMAGGGMNRDTLTDQMKMGARRYGMSGEDTLQTMLQARGVLGNKGAQESFNPIMENQRFLGIDAGTTAQSIETMAGAEGGSRSSAANKQSDIIKKGVAAGLDVSKSGKFLQNTMQYLQSTVGLGRADTDAATTRLANMTQGLSGGGDVTDTQLQQAQTLAQMLHGESSSIQGLSGAANLNQIQGISSKYGGFGTGTTMALAGLSSNAGEKDILDVLANGQDNGEVGKNVDLNQAVKDIQSAKQKDATMDFMKQIAGGNNNLAIGALGAENNFQGNFTTESMLGRQRADNGQITPAGMQGAQEAIEGAKAGVTQSPEFQLDVAQFTRSTESAAKGLDTFTTVTEQMTNQMKKLLTDLEAAQKRFADMSRQTGYGGIQR